MAEQFHLENLQALYCIFQGWLLWICFMSNQVQVKTDFLQCVTKLTRVSMLKFCVFYDETKRFLAFLSCIDTHRWNRNWEGKWNCASQGCEVGIFKAKFQKFDFFKSGLAWKNGVWHVRHSLAFFWLFLMVLAWKNIVWPFLKPEASGSVTQFTAVGLELRAFSEDNVLSFLLQSHSRRCKRLCRLSDVTGQET